MSDMQIGQNPQPAVGGFKQVSGKLEKTLTQPLKQYVKTHISGRCTNQEVKISQASRSARGFKRVGLMAAGLGLGLAGSITAVVTTPLAALSGLFVGLARGAKAKKSGDSFKKIFKQTVGKALGQSAGLTSGLFKASATAFSGMVTKVDQSKMSERIARQLKEELLSIKKEVQEKDVKKGRWSEDKQPILTLTKSGVSIKFDKKDEPFHEKRIVFRDGERGGRLFKFLKNLTPEDARKLLEDDEALNNWWPAQSTDRYQNIQNRTPFDRHLGFLCFQVGVIRDCVIKKLGPAAEAPQLEVRLEMPGDCLARGIEGIFKEDGQYEFRVRASKLKDQLSKYSTN